MKAEILWNSCRVCLQEGNLHSIYEKDENGLDICNKIMLCGDITINRESNLPDKICETCRSLLEAAYNFRIQCKRSDSILLQLFSEGANMDEENCEIGPISSEMNIKIECYSNTEDDPQDDVSESNNSGEYLSLAEVPDHQAEQEFDMANANQPIMQEQFQISRKSKGKRDDGRNENNIKEKCQQNNDVYNSVNVRNKSNESQNIHICEICGNIYKYKSALSTHMRRHNNEKPYSCEICGNSFAVNGQLTSHMRTHTGDKPYECRFCKRKYADIGSRKVHERTHTGERPFKCEICEKTFTYASVLRKHKVIHTGEKQYSCDHCGKEFRFRYHLTAHLNTLKHQDKISEECEDKSNRQNIDLHD